MYKEYFKEFDKIKAPERAVDDAVKLALSKTEKDQISTSKNYRRVFVSLAAACLLLVFAGTLVLGLHTESPNITNNVSTSSEQLKYGFVIKANSAKLQDKAVIGAYSGTVTGGWVMFENFEKGKDFSPNFFQSYGFSHFNIEGEGIKSVTFKTDKEGVYFAISPAGYYLDTDEDTANQKVIEASENYYDIYLTKSQYTADELNEYSDGLSLGNVYCDTFRYANDSDSDCISFSNKLELVIESSHKNVKVSEKLDRIWQCEQELIEIRSHRTAESGKLTDREEALYEEMDILSQDIRTLVLSGATITVSVEFKDGRIVEKTLKLGLEVREENGMWLTISE